MPAHPNPVGYRTIRAISCCELVLRCPVQVTVRVTDWARTLAHTKVLYQLISGLCISGLCTRCTTALSWPRRKEDQMCGYISNWLQQAPESSVHHSTEAQGSTIQNPHDPAAAIWATSMLHAHIDELTELNAIDVDGFIYVTATHADTSYSTERVYQSLHLAKCDLLLWIKSCSNRNTSASVHVCGT